MTKNELIELLNEDLRNEYKHMHFYLHSSAVIRGLHREELREFLAEQAADEMTHVRAFTDLLVGLGKDVPASLPNSFPHLTSPTDILHYALDMEEEVISNYVIRMNQAQEFGGVDGRWIEIFLEEQIMDSRKDADNIKQMLR